MRPEFTAIINRNIRLITLAFVIYSTRSRLFHHISLSPYLPLTLPTSPTTPRNSPQIHAFSPPQHTRPRPPLPLSPPTTTRPLLRDTLLKLTTYSPRHTYLRSTSRHSPPTYPRPPIDTRPHPPLHNTRSPHRNIPTRHTPSPTTYISTSYLFNATDTHGKSSKYLTILHYILHGTGYINQVSNLSYPKFIDAT